MRFPQVFLVIAVRVLQSIGQAARDIPRVGRNNGSVLQCHRLSRIFRTIGGLALFWCPHHPSTDCGEVLCYGALFSSIKPKPPKPAKGVPCPPSFLNSGLKVKVKARHPSLVSSIPGTD